MSDFLMCQILLNISNTINIKLNIPNPSKSIQFIVLKHFIIFVCIPFLSGIAESLTWQSTENHHPSLAEAKDSRIQGTGTLSVYFCRDLSQLLFRVMTFFLWWHEFFLKNGHAFFIPLFSILSSFFNLFLCVWFGFMIFFTPLWIIPNFSSPDLVLHSRPPLLPCFSPRLNSRSHFTDVRPRTLLYLFYIIRSYDFRTFLVSFYGLFGLLHACKGDFVQSSLFQNFYYIFLSFLKPVISKIS